ncbi:MAG TPA: FecR domain-containing protein [Polyangiaceae bacterium]|nr:FecR domain-containing protein [Polyangiaceae bacterium]
MTDACERWMEVSDRLMVGEQISAHEREFLRVHASTCSECSVEAAALRELKPLPLHSVPSHEEVDRILQAAFASERSVQVAEHPVLDDSQLETTLLYVPKRAEPAPGFAPEPERDPRSLRERIPERISQPLPQRPAAPRFRAWTAGLLTACGVAAAAAGFLVFRQLPRAAIDTASAAVGPSPAPSVGAAQGSPRVALSDSGAGSHEVITRNQEDTCGEVLSGVTLCLTRGSEVSRVELAGADRTVYLKRGRAIASLAPQPPGTSFSIVTASGRVTAVGTVFSVEVTAEGGSIARVARGKVLVRAPAAGADHALLAGQMLRLGESESLRLTRTDQDQDLSLLEQLAPDSPGLVAHGAIIDLDANDEESPPRRVSRKVKDQLQRARELRKRGDFSGAAAVYRAVHQDNPHSAEGRAALLSLAGLLLSPLNDPASALSAYNAYLATGRGTLAAQAEYGRIRALRSLGRTSEEHSATEAFLEHFPNAPEARALKQPKPSSSSRRELMR